MTRGFSQAIVVAALLSLGSRATSAQLVCQFSRTLLLSSLRPDTAATAPRLSVAANAIYSFNLSPQNRAAAGDVTYRIAPYIHIAGGVAYCNTRLGIPKRPIFGLTGSWMHHVGDDWLFAAQVGASYVNLDLGAGAHQQETVIPGVVVLGYRYERLVAYAGGLVQYRHESFPNGSSESRGEIGAVVGFQVTLATPLALGVAYNLVRFVDPRGVAGRIDHGVVRLEYAFARR